MQVYEGRPENCEGRSEREIRTYDMLDSLGIKFLRTDHNRARSMDELHSVDLTLDVMICKNLFLCNRQQTNFYLLMMPAAKAFKTKDLSPQLGVSRLSFAKEEFMEEFLDLHPGSVSIMGLMNDHDNRVQLIIDEDVVSGEFVGCHPCENTTSLKMKTEDLLNKFLPAVNHNPIFVKL